MRVASRWRERDRADTSTSSAHAGRRDNAAAFLIRHRDRLPRRHVRQQELAQPTERSGGGTPPAILGPDAEHQGPLFTQRAIRVQQRRVRVVDIGGLRGRAVELDDGEGLAAAELVHAAIADVEAADEEAGHLLRDRVDRGLERGRDEVMAVAEQRALGMIPRDSERDPLPVRGHQRRARPQAPQECVGLHAEARVRPDEPFKRADTVAGYLRKDLVSDRARAETHPDGQAHQHIAQNRQS